MEKEEKEGVLLCYPRNSTCNWGASHSPSNPSSMRGQGRELNAKSVPLSGNRSSWRCCSRSPALGEEQRISHGGLGGPGGSLGTTELCPSCALRSYEVTGAAAAVQEQASTAWENICPANGATRKSLGARSENHFEVPIEGLGFNTFSPVCRE